MIHDKLRDAIAIRLHIAGQPSIHGRNVQLPVGAVISQPCAIDVGVDGAAVSFFDSLMMMFDEP